MANEMNNEQASEPNFDALLKAMPDIAEAVKAFPEPVQEQVYESLVEAFYGGAAVAPSSTGPAPKAPARRKSRVRKAEGGGDPGAKARKRTTG